MASPEVGVGIAGSGFIARLHADAFSRPAVASVRAIASRSADRAEAFARQWGIPAWHTDFRELAEQEAAQPPFAQLGSGSGVPRP